MVPPAAIVRTGPPPALPEGEDPVRTLRVAHHAKELRPQRGS